MTTTSEATARHIYDTIVSSLDAARLTGDYDELYDLALDVAVRAWWTPVGRPLLPEEYCIDICWGGPAVRVRGDLSKHMDAASAVLEYQDWGTPWEPLWDVDESVLLQFANLFLEGVAIQYGASVTD